MLTEQLCISRALLNFTVQQYVRLPFNSVLQNTTEALSQIELFNLFWLIFKRGSVLTDSREKTTKIRAQLQGIVHTWHPPTHGGVS